MTTAHAVRPLHLAVLVGLTLALAACASAAAPTSPAAPAGSPSISQPASADPSTGHDDPVSQPAGPGSSGGGFSGSGDGGNLVIPHPGTVNPHPVAVESIVANVDGRHVTAKLTWTSGVEPCYVLDSVVVSRDGSAIDVTVVEGAADPGAICIEIAMTKSTIVDLGDLDPGTYTISATNSQIPPVVLTVG